MNAITASYNRVTLTLDNAAPWVALLLLRVLIGWEFLDAGIEKFNGQNWFASIQHQFPFPFNQIPTSISWFIATWFGATASVTKGLATSSSP